MNNDTIEGEVVEVSYGRKPEECNDPDLFPDDGFDYVLVKLPRGLFPESPGTISVSFGNRRPLLRVARV